MSTVTPLRRSKRIALRENKRQEQEFHTLRRSPRIAAAQYAAYHAAAQEILDNTSTPAETLRVLMHATECAENLEIKKINVFYVYKHLNTDAKYMLTTSTKFRRQVYETSQNLLRDLDNCPWSINTDALRPLLQEMIDTIRASDPTL